VVIGLLDTSILVDLLRQHSSADAWLARQGQLGITRIVLLEIVEGAENAAQQSEALKMLRRFEVEELTPSDLVWATEQLVRFRLSHSVDAFDCLIAAASYRLQLPLYTTNLKHFAPMLGGLAQKPY
jgi:predicted nucleic acid-binding protein